MIHNVLVDLNGCLMGPPSSELFEGHHEFAQIAEAAKRSGDFLIGACSGREMSYVRGVLHMVGSPRGWSICESGLGLLSIEQEIWLPNPVLTSEIREVFREVIGRHVPAIMKQFPQGALRLYRGNELNIAIELTGAATVAIEDLHGVVQEELADLIRQRLVSPPHHSEDTSDITAYGIDKGSGVIHGEQVTGVPRSSTLGIGDTDGDAPMIKLVGFAGCPANASKECTALVHAKGTKNGYVSPYFYARGVTDIMRHFLEI